MKYIITEEQLKGIIEYLASKPYAEVAKGIALLSQLPKVEDKKE